MTPAHSLKMPTLCLEDKKLWQLASQPNLLPYLILYMQRIKWTLHKLFKPLRDSLLVKIDYKILLMKFNRSSKRSLDGRWLKAVLRHRKRL